MLRSTDGGVFTYRWGSRSTASDAPHESCSAIIRVLTTVSPLGRGSPVSARMEQTGLLVVSSGANDSEVGNEPDLVSMTLGIPIPQSRIDIRSQTPRRGGPSRASPRSERVKGLCWSTGK